MKRQSDLDTRWIKEEGPEMDAVITSRIRLARNFSDYRFAHLASDDELQSIIKEVSDCISKEQDFGKLTLIDLETLTPFEREVLVAKHLISTEQAKNVKNRAVIFNEDQSISIMVNEEDHLRIQTLLPGLQVEEAWKLATRVDDFLEACISYAFSEELGFLTACPTNVGTGIRISTMLHLPALTMLKQIGKVLSVISQLGLAVRGFYGEGTQALSDIYQISNQVTLGHTEGELIDSVDSIVAQIVEQERNAREILLKQGKHQLEDKVYRAYGTLTNARVISFKETLELLSVVRLGVFTGLLSGVSPSTLNDLLVMTTPAYVNNTAGRELSTFERDVARAEMIRNHLK